MKAQIDPALEQLTEAVIGAAIQVSNTLGHGFSEKVYQGALLLELNRRGLAVVQEVPYKVHYLGEEVGTYYADIVVEEKVILELKAVEALLNAHRGQLLNYMRASGLRAGLLFNFGKPRVEIRRVLV